MTYAYDLVVIGSGPVGQKAAVQAAKLKQRVALIERDRYLGGACVHRGTIPSKTLRENALRLKHLRANAKLVNFTLHEEIEMTTLIDRLDEVLKAHDQYMENQISRNNIDRLHGRAEFVDTHSVKVTLVRGEPYTITAEKIVIATGSYPNHPEHINIDHEYIFDSDSILSMLYLPKSLLVLGGGVIASEYASIFQTLGVKVTMIDKYDRPLGFLDEDLTSRFIESFTREGGTWVGNTVVTKSSWVGDKVIVETKDGGTFSGERLLCAAGRSANVDGLQLEKAGLSVNERGLISVDENLQTDVSNIFAAGDVIGPPSLASTSMEQGRRASCNAFNNKIGNMSQMIPTGIYGIPELSCVGLSEEAAVAKYGEVIIGRAKFEEIARGQISGITDGMLKIVCDSQGERILGVMIVGEGATELVHIGQMALLANANIDIFIESVFNFPTLAEAYRVAALSVIGQRTKAQQAF